MKITDKDILRTVVELRDEENRQLQVRPLPRPNRPRTVAWFSAVAAAAVAGFFLGFWTNNRSTSDLPMIALVDTIYVTRETATKTEPVAPAPTAISTISASSSRPTPHATRPVCTSSAPRAGRPAQLQKAAKQPQTITTGQAIINDNIRYDLLIRG